MASDKAMGFSIELWAFAVLSAGVGFWVKERCKAPPLPRGGGGSEIVGARLSQHAPDIAVVKEGYNPFRTAVVPFWGQTTQNLCGLI